MAAVTICSDFGKNLNAGQEATVRTGHGTTHWVVPKLGKECVKAVGRHPAYLPYAECTRETLGWTAHKLESRLPREMSTSSDMQVTPL